MPRTGLINMILGFGTLFFAAAVGAFIANDTTQAFIKDKALLDSWHLMLMRSSHGHTNLFAVIHVCFGLTIPYSQLKERTKNLQTVALFGGTLAMGPLMLVRSYLPPSDGVGPLEALTGALLSFSLFAIGGHCYGLLLKWQRR